MGAREQLVCLLELQDLADRYAGYAPVPKHPAGCYLCGRCTEACPVDGALIYTRAKREG